MKFEEEEEEESRIYFGAKKLGTNEQRNILKRFPKTGINFLSFYLLAAVFRRERRHQDDEDEKE